jgi:DNA-binding transcriptional ArsR family regulator
MAKSNARGGRGRMNDPWAFQRWALDVRTGSAGRKAVLMMLATMADTNTGRCEAKQDTLAKACEAAQRTVRAHLFALEEAGIIARREQRRVDGSRRGDEFLLLAPWVSEWPDGLAARSAASGGAAESIPGVGTESAAQERPPENDRPPSERERARAKADEVPDDFPDALRPHARIVYPLLRDVAEQHNARPVTARAVALTIMGNPGRRFVSEAHAFAAWAQSPPRPIKDVVGSYRTWLKRAEVFAGVEQIVPLASNESAARFDENVRPLRRRGSGRSTAADYQNLKGRLG